MNKLTQLLLVVSLIVISISCKKDPDPEPEPDTGGTGGTDTTSAPRYDMVDFDLDILYTQGEDNRPEKIIELDGKLWGIARNVNEYNLVSSDGPEGPWTIEYNNGKVLYSIAKSVGDGVCIVNLESGFLISTDQGQSWQEKQAVGADLSNLFGGAEVSASQSVILLATNSVNESALYYSTDFGSTFTKSKEGAVGQGAFVLAIDNDHFLACLGDTVYSSVNGVDWVGRHAVNGFGLFTYHDYETEITYGLFNQELWASSDFGHNWQKMSSETVRVKGKMPNGDLVATRLTSGVGYEVVRSYSNGTIWLKLGGLARDVDVVAHDGKTVAADGTGVYALEPGRTEWDFYPIVQPQYDVRNRGTQSAEVTSNQLMVSYDDRETWQVTNSFSNNVSFHTRIGYGKIAVITQTGGFFNVGANCHVLNSSGSLLEDTYSLPWSGTVDNFVSDGIYIACVFHGDKDIIGYTNDLKNWQLLQTPDGMDQIHFLQRDELGGITIGFEGKNSKDFKEFTSTNLDLLVEDGLFGEPVNNATNGWPGYYEYEEFDAVHYGKFQDSYAIFGDDMYVYSPETERWYKSKVYPTLDGIKQTILKTGFLNHSNYLISPGAVSTTPFEVEKVN